MDEQTKFSNYLMRKSPQELKVNIADYSMGLTKEAVRDLIFYSAKTGNIYARKTRGKVRAGSLIGTVSNQGDILITLIGERLTAQKLAWWYINGTLPAQTITHRNGNRFDNHFKNLVPEGRLSRVLRKSSTTGLKPLSVRGVYEKITGAPYSARIGEYGNDEKIGSAETYEEAVAMVWREAERRGIRREYLGNLVYLEEKGLI